MADEQTSPVKLMMGTDGHLDYGVLARNANVLLGFKMYGIVPGIKMGHPNTIYFQARVRAADVPSGWDSDSKVVNLFEQLSPSEAFPKIDFEKVGKTRDGSGDYASITCGLFVPIVGEDVPKTMQGLIDEKHVAEKMWEWLVQKTDPEHLLFPEDITKEWLHKLFLEPMLKIIEIEKSQAEIKAGVSANIGKFGSSAELLGKSIKKKTMIPPHSDDSGAVVDQWLFYAEKGDGNTNVMIVKKDYWEANEELCDEHITDELGDLLPEGFEEVAESMFLFNGPVAAARKLLKEKGMKEEKKLLDGQ